MKVIYEKPKGQRIKKGIFCGVTVFKNGIWWCYECKKWIDMNENPECEKHDRTTHMPCRSIKVYKRAMKKHPIIRKDSILCSRFVGYNVFSDGNTKMKWEKKK